MLMKRPERTSSSWKKRGDKRLSLKKNVAKSMTNLRPKEKKNYANIVKPSECRRKQSLVNKKRNVKRGKNSWKSSRSRMMTGKRESVKKNNVKRLRKNLSKMPSTLLKELKILSWRKKRLKCTELKRQLVK
jgi:hypothetical protein